jgi:hypothetical protein
VAYVYWASKFSEHYLPLQTQSNALILIIPLTLSQNFGEPYLFLFSMMVHWSNAYVCGTGVTYAYEASWKVDLECKMHPTHTSNTVRI